MFFHVLSDDDGAGRSQDQKIPRHRAADSQGIHASVGIPASR
ncbi:hypothetical protein [Methylococcus sp. BF19-07]|nr:hypothetical protein [Methylococcus sp. BF19-07]